jgi:hypothetical protein
MNRLTRPFLKSALIAIVVGTMVGCAGGHKASGKYSNLDKPKPVEKPK